MNTFLTVVKNSQIFKTHRQLLFALGFLFCVFLDQIVKYFITEPFLNDKFAFSLPVPTALIYFIYLVVMISMGYYVSVNFKTLSLIKKIAWLLIFSGAVSNIGERIILGYVRDFIYISFYKWTGVYNLADGLIILGIIVLLFSQRESFN